MLCGIFFVVAVGIADPYALGTNWHLIRFRGHRSFISLPVDLGLSPFSMWSVGYVPK